MRLLILFLLAESAMGQTTVKVGPCKPGATVCVEGNGNQVTGAVGEVDVSPGSTGTLIDGVPVPCTSDICPAIQVPAPTTVLGCQKGYSLDYGPTLLMINPPPPPQCVKDKPVVEQFTYDQLPNGIAPSPTIEELMRKLINDARGLEMALLSQFSDKPNSAAWKDEADGYYDVIEHDKAAIRNMVEARHGH